MYDYIYQAGQQNKQTLILLHGTGGDEKNLLPVAHALDPNANVLSVRGNVTENGMSRYFKRHSEGQYDWTDLEQRAKDLYQFIKISAEKYNFVLEEAIYLGFSNGANIALKMLINEQNKINKGMLFAPMFPKDIEADIDLSTRTVYLSMGKNDPIVPLAESQRVIQLFTNHGAKVTKYWVDSHEMNEATLLAGKKWYKQLNKI